VSAAVRDTQREGEIVRLLAADDTSLFHPCPTDSTCSYCKGDINEAAVLDWSFVDRAYCISLESRPDRTAAAAAEFHRVGLCRRVLFYRPAKHPKSTKQGIWTSHRAVAAHARRRGSKRTLIMEDDVLFSRRLGPASLERAQRALDLLPPHWTIFFLGHWPLWAYFAKPGILRTGSVCAHAYIASPLLLEWLHHHPSAKEKVQKTPKVIGSGIDAAYARLEAAYALFPMIAIQSGSKSDNVKHRGTRKKRRLRHLIRYSRYRERLLSRLLRPNEFLVVAFSPLMFAVRRAALMARGAHRVPLAAEPQVTRSLPR